MPRYRLVNGVRVQYTAEEENLRDQEEAAWNNGAFDRAIADLRAKRDKDLLESDWTQLGDTTLTNDQKQAWMRFRTELRDITKGLTTVDDVNNLDYPDKPNG
jgi:heme oxygenase